MPNGLAIFRDVGGAGEMTITTEELARIRAAAIGDMLGDSRAFDEMGPSTVVFRLCRELERLDREADWLTRAAEMGGCNSTIVCERCPNGDKRLKRCYGKDMRVAARKAIEEGR